MSTAGSPSLAQYCMHQLFPPEVKLLHRHLDVEWTLVHEHSLEHHSLMLPSAHCQWLEAAWQQGCS